MSFVYTLGLKRRHPRRNIVIGGAAGCFPGAGRMGRGDRAGQPAAGAAVRRHLLLDRPARTFWALAMKFRDDYAAANVPIAGRWFASAAVVARKIVFYSYAMVRGPRWGPWPRTRAGL